MYFFLQSHLWVRGAYGEMPAPSNSAVTMMNFCSLYGHVADEFSGQATQYEFQVTIKQGCKLEASGLNLDDRHGSIGWHYVLQNI